MAISDLDDLRAGSLAGRRTLNLGGCALDELPGEVFGLADTLEELDLSGNRLTDLPAEFGRLTRLRRLFCSRNPFDSFPLVLGDCPSLTQVGFRGCGMRRMAFEALPSSIRWLTLTDNRLESLPPRLGGLPSLQKLMLAGNRLRALPDSLAGASSLELLRISANDLPALPSWLAELPVLSWLAFAGNPCEARRAETPPPDVRWDELRLGHMIGEGASGRVHAARWASMSDRAVAVKLFKGAMTSDGLPDSERRACLAAGLHPHLVGAIGALRGHPSGIGGLVMPLVPPGWRALAEPPSAESCSRDVYADDFRLTMPVATRIARCVGAAAAHLHARGLMHGDLYAHNTLWDGSSGDARLSDFGAASSLAGGDERLARIEVRAWGLLLGELLDRVEGGAAKDVCDLHDACTSHRPSTRPAMRDVLDAFARLAD